MHTKPRKNRRVSAALARPGWAPVERLKRLLDTANHLLATATFRGPPTCKGCGTYFLIGMRPAHTHCRACDPAHYGAI